MVHRSVPAAAALAAVRARVFERVLGPCGAASARAVRAQRAGPRPGTRRTRVDCGGRLATESVRRVLSALALTLVAVPAGAQSTVDSVLLRAAAAGNAEAVGAALAQGADPNAADAEGATPLLWAAHAGSVDGLQRLLRAGADPRRRGVIWTDPNRARFYGSLLAAAAGRGHVAVLRHLVGAERMGVDEPAWNPKDRALTGWTPLQWAAAAGQARAAEYLLDAGASADRAADARADAPLVLAADGGYAPTVHRLLCHVRGVTSDRTRSSASAAAEANGHTWLGAVLWMDRAAACRVLGDEDAVRRLRVADSLNASAVDAFADGRYAAARGMAERAARSQASVLGSRHPALGTSLNNAAAALRAGGDLAGARALFERVRALHEATLPPSHPNAARGLNNLAAVLRDQGDLAGARALFERALALLEAHVPRGHPDVATGLSNLAGVLRDQGDLAAARALYERALAAHEAALSSAHPAVGTDLNNVATVLRAQGDVAGARTLFERALRIREAELPRGHPDVANSLSNLAGVLRDQGDRAGARALYERALATYEAALPPGHPEIARALTRLAGAQRDAGDLAGARALLRRALALQADVLPPEHPDIIENLNDFALYSWEAGAAAPDELFLLTSRMRQENAGRLLPTLSLAEQTLYVAQATPFSVAGLLSRAAERATASARDPQIAEMYRAVAGFKGLLPHGLRRQAAFARLEPHPTYGPVYRRLQALRTNLAAWYQRAGTLPLADWQAGADSLTRQKEASERTLARVLQAGATDDPWSTYGLAGLRRRLAPGTVFVDLYRYEALERGRYVGARYGAFVVSRRAGPTFVPLGSAARIDAVLARWRGEVLAGRDGVAATDDLVEAAWTPIAEALPEGTRRVWLSPDAQLARLPWNWLAAQHAGTQDLLLAHVTSARDLVRLLTAAPPVGAPSAVVVGDVDFGPGTLVTGVASAAWQSLPATRDEVDAIASLAPAHGIAPTVLTGIGATRGAVTAALGTVRYAHLATHGFFSREDEAEHPDRGRAESGLPPGAVARTGARNPLVGSGLALAGANAGPAGALTAEEMLGLDLRQVRLVVLSACETGRGTEITGQGVMGLRASIGAAGARALVMSLWKVPDASTALLMGHFYRNVWARNLGPADALRRAQAAVRADPRFAAPVHWAAWVLDGDGWPAP